jgi:hypothetical protein
MTSRLQRREGRTASRSSLLKQGFELVIRPTCINGADVCYSLSFQNHRHAVHCEVSNRLKLVSVDALTGLSEARPRLVPVRELRVLSNPSHLPYSISNFHHDADIPN